MPIYFIPIIYTGILALLLIVIVPKTEIRHLSIYGIIFGALFDILTLIAGKLTGFFGYINYGPLGIMGIHYFAPISWAIFFVLYFYFLPKRKVFMFIYVATAVIFSVFVGNSLDNLGILRRSHGMLDSIIAFPLWYSAATWGYLRLTKHSFAIKEFQ